MINKKRLLIQSYKFPPVHVVGAQRVYQFYHSFKQVFDEVVAITTDNRKDFPSDLSIAVPNAEVFEIPTNDLRSWLMKKGSVGAYLSQEDQSFFDAFGLRHLYYSFPFVKYFGDGGIGYISRSYQKAVELIESRGITHIFTSYQPWSDHLVAYRLKKKFPHLIWMADFRDFPVDEIRKDVWWPQLQRYYLRKYTQKVDVLTTVSDGLAKLFKLYHNNVVVVRNGLSQLPAQFMTAPMDGQFSISYTGSIYPKLQTAAVLFEALRELLNEDKINPVHLALRYAGKDSEIWQKWLYQFGLSHFNKDYSILPLKEAKAVQQISQINLLLSWSAKDNGGIVTAKLAHYLTAGRPIVTILNGPDDSELTQLVEQTGAGKVFSTSKENSKTALKQFLLQSYQTWAFSGALPWQISPAKLLPYTWAQQISHLEKALLDFGP